MRPVDVSDGDIHLTGAAASTPQLHDIQKTVNGQRPRSITVNEFMDVSTGRDQSKPGPSGSKHLMDFTQATPESGNANQFRPMFKPDLAISTSPVDKNSLSVQDDCISELPHKYSRFLTCNNLRSPLRSQLILKKIRELDTKITALQWHLESDERHARNIAILTPFRKTTRSKLLTVIQNLAKPLMRMRLEMEKLKCYRTVLLSDLVSESRFRMQTKRTAMRSATDSLRRPNTAPTMIFQTYDDFGKQNSTPASLSNSTSGFFHSARESAFDWPSEFADDVPMHPSPKPDFQKRAPKFEAEHDMLFGTPSSPSQNHLKDHSVHPYRDSSSENASQGDDDDQAEDWNKTRVAQRVSLIHFPSDFAISTRLKAVFECNNDQG
jgi:hypothetical protein